MVGSAAELGGDAAVVGNVEDSDLLIIGSGETSVGGNVDNTNISVDQEPDQYKTSLVVGTAALCLSIQEIFFV